MNSEQPLKHNSLLFRDISQFEVDFVIPRVGSDLPLWIDPFLMYKSRDPHLSKLHSALLTAFNYGIKLISEKKFREAENYFRFPEAKEIGFGYSKGNKHGDGVGEYLASLIISSLNDSPSLLKRGMKHIEEMQLISVGIGVDRISDATANLIKFPLINYTQTQCKIWGIKLYTDVPIENVFDYETGKWFDGYFDLPLSPFNKEPLIFVPRRIVRTLPWINFFDYRQMEFSAYLRAKRTKRKLKLIEKELSTSSAKQDKPEIALISRREVERIDRYITKKEETASEAQPSNNYLNQDKICPESNALKIKLQNLVAGKKDATAYQHLILEILNFLFSPELIDGKPEVRTIDGTERRDIIFTNDSDQTFWSYLRTEHSSIFIMFEVKNTAEIINSYLNQTATYLGDRLGRLGFIVTRNPLEEAQQRKAFSIYNEPPRKIILVLSDIDINNMLDMKCEGKNPMRYIQDLYRTFRTSVQ